MITLLAGSLACYQVWITWPSKTLTLWERFKAAKKRLVLFKLLLVIVILVAALPILKQPLYPPLNGDATAYHLAAAKIYVQSHSVQITPYLRYPVFPQNITMLFTLMLLVYDDVAAQLVHFLTLILIAIALHAWGCRAFTPQVGWWAAVLWLSNPGVLEISSIGLIDIGLTLFVSLGAYSFFNCIYTRNRGWLIIAGVFIGFAVGTKYSALFFLVAFAVSALFIGLNDKKWSYSVFFTLAATIVGAPWYLYNAYYTGNPFFPFLGKVFGYSLWSPEEIDSLMKTTAGFGTGTKISSLLLLPWNLTFYPDLFHPSGSRFSPIYFFTFPLVLVFGAKYARIRALLILTAAYTLFWFSTAQQARYLIPVLPMLSLATASALENFLVLLSSFRNYLRTVFAVIVVVCLMIYPGWLYASRRKIIERGPLPVSTEQREAYLLRQIPSYAAIKFLNESKGRNYSVFALYDSEMAYFADGVLMGDWCGPAGMIRMANKLNDSEALYNELKSLGANYLMDSRYFVKVNLPSDEFFFSHFKLIYGRAYVSLFERAERPVLRKLGPELVQNPSFENLYGQMPNGWQYYGNPVADTSSLDRHSGHVSMHCNSSRDGLYQILPARPGVLYRLSSYARTTQSGHKALLQVKWLDKQGNLLIADSETFETDLDWKRYEMALTAPPAATTAIIYAAAHEESSIWFDDFSFTELIYEPITQNH
ncbi:MAG: glycosyltransferase family 39 protein [Acidobacteria bacterium]|nr:glycosyltransferase family 39 protein [Acidobacteriota bacterium]